VIYNFGRGNSIDEAALAEALRSGSIAGACLDVFAVEPLPETSPLADETLPGLVRMPHASAYCECYIDRCLDEFIEWLR
jgi:phosphoglycerate dehydrogenase-like enzyme